MPQSRTVYSIQVLRGIAALLVVLYHYSHYLKGANTGFIPFDGGYVGVDIFFMISGFVIVHATEAAEHAIPSDFLIRRFFRVVPLAQLATLAYFMIIATRPPLRLLWQSLLFYPRADTDPPKFGFPLVPQEWTLIYELIFYAIFALTLVVTHRRRMEVSAIALVACVFAFQWALGGPVTLYPNRVYLPATPGFIPPEILGTLGNPIMLEFAVGMILAVAYRRYSGALRAAKRPWVGQGLGLLLAAVFLRTYLTANDPGNGILDKGAGAACLVVGGLLLEACWGKAASALGSRILSAFMWLGTISYSLYLVHFGIAERLLRRVCSLFFGLRVEGGWGFLALVAASILVASAVHVFVERPLIGIGKRAVDLRHRWSGQGSSPLPR